MSKNQYNSRSFRDSIEFENRKKIAQNVLTVHPDRIPVIVESYNGEIEMGKNKFLVPKEITMSKFILEIRRNVTLDASQSLFLFIVAKNSHIAVQANMIMESIYNKYANLDGMLYVIISKENTFG